MRLQDLIADYVDLRRAMGHKFITGKVVLQAFCRTVGNDLDVQDIDAERVKSFLGPTTTCNWHRKYATLKVFYRYAISRGHVSSSPLPSTLPKLPPPFVAYIYSVDEVRRLLDATTSYRKTHPVLEPHTFRALLLTLYGAGLRISEAVSLSVGDVDLAEGLLLIRETKFYKSRLLPIADLKQALMGYATQRRESGHAESAESPFFVGRNGNSLKINTVQESFQTLRQHAGIRRPDGVRQQPRLHDMRHNSGNRIIPSTDRQGGLLWEDRAIADATMAA